MSYKSFADVTNTRPEKARAFITICPFPPRLMFAGKTSTQVGSIIACKYQTRVELIDSSKRSSLQSEGIKNGYKKFMIIGTRKTWAYLFKKALSRQCIR